MQIQFGETYRPILKPRQRTAKVLSSEIRLTEAQSKALMLEEMTSTVLPLSDSFLENVDTIIKSKIEKLNQAPLNAFYRLLEKIGLNPRFADFYQLDKTDHDKSDYPILPKSTCLTTDGPNHQTSTQLINFINETPYPEYSDTDNKTDEPNDYYLSQNAILEKNGITDIEIEFDVVDGEVVITNKDIIKQQILNTPT